jgi:TolA-binding protein
LISASGALAAALGTRPWHALTELFASVPEPASGGKRPAAGAGKPRTMNNAALAPSASPPSAAPPVAAAPVAAAPVAAAPVAAAPLVAVRVAAAPLPKLRANADVTTQSRPLRAELANAAPASSSAPAEPSGPAQLFAEANQARRAGQVGRASGLYHLLQEQYPGSSEAELSRVTLSTLLLNGGDASGALSGFERYLAGPSRVLEAEALVGRARALERLGRRQLEGAAWREVLRRFPGSVYARQAAERLTALGQP